MTFRILNMAAFATYGELPMEMCIRDRFYANISFPDYTNPCFSDAKLTTKKEMVKNYKAWGKLCLLYTSNGDFSRLSPLHGVSRKKNS